MAKNTQMLPLRWLIITKAVSIEIRPLSEYQKLSNLRTIKPIDLGKNFDYKFLEKKLNN